MLQSPILGAHLILLQTVWWACVGVSVGANATPHVHINHVHCSVGPCHQNYICIVLSGNSNRYYTGTISYKQSVNSLAHRV